MLENKIAACYEHSDKLIDDLVFLELISYFYNNQEKDTLNQFEDLVVSISKDYLITNTIAGTEFLDIVEKLSAIEIQSKTPL